MASRTALSWLAYRCACCADYLRCSVDSHSPCGWLHRRFGLGGRFLFFGDLVTQKDRAGRSGGVQIGPKTRAKFFKFVPQRGAAGTGPVFFAVWFLAKTPPSF